MNIFTSILAYIFSFIFYISDAPEYVYLPWILVGFGFTGWAIEERRDRFESELGKIFCKWYWGKKT